MNYQRIYNAIMTRAVERGTVEGYSEQHHILPRCLGGSNERSNLVDLTAREHVIAHILLARIHPEDYKLNHAAWSMMNNRGVKVNSRVAAGLRERQAQFVSAAYSNPDSKLGTDEHRAALSASKKAAWADPNSKFNSDEYRAAMSVGFIASYTEKCEATGRKRTAKVGAPRPGTIKEQIWLLCEKLYRELGEGCNRQLILKSARDSGITTPMSAKAYFRFWQCHRFVHNLPYEPANLRLAA